MLVKFGSISGDTDKALQESSFVFDLDQLVPYYSENCFKFPLGNFVLYKVYLLSGVLWRNVQAFVDQSCHVKGCHCRSYLSSGFFIMCDSYYLIDNIQPMILLFGPTVWTYWCKIQQCLWWHWSCPLQTPYFGMIFSVSCMVDMHSGSRRAYFKWSRAKKYYMFNS